MAGRAIGEDRAEHGTVTAPPATDGAVATEQEAALELAHRTADMPPSDVIHCVAAKRLIVGAGWVVAGTGARLRTKTTMRTTRATTDTLARWKLVDTPIVPWLPASSAYPTSVARCRPLRVAQTPLNATGTAGTRSASRWKAKDILRVVSATRHGGTGRVGVRRGRA